MPQTGKKSFQQPYIGLHSHLGTILATCPAGCKTKLLWTCPRLENRSLKPSSPGGYIYAKITLKKSFNPSARLSFSLIFRAKMAEGFDFQILQQGSAQKGREAGVRAAVPCRKTVIDEELAAPFGQALGLAREVQGLNFQSLRLNAQKAALRRCISLRTPGNSCGGGMAKPTMKPRIFEKPKSEIPDETEDFCCFRSFLLHSLFVMPLIPVSGNRG